MKPADFYSFVREMAEEIGLPEEMLILGGDHLGPLTWQDLPEEEAFLWLMKDGDDMIAVGCKYGQVSAVENVSFAPGGAINWTPTITAMGDSGMELIMDDGQVVV